MTERPPADETRPYGATPAPWPPPPPTVVEHAPYPPFPPTPTTTPTRSTADLVASIVLLVLGLLLGLVASAVAFLLQVVQIGCEAGGACAEGVQDGVAIALAGPWLVFLPLGAVAILLMARQRTSWWVSLLAVLGASAVWLYGAWLALDSATW
ncbi:hypothetical protein [Nocardioides zeae]|uniref:Uncharacterized protein n=1 Tax=Nocardioides zeae TaxID=1457234 RepID=A0AAJ1TZS1_9ACTN|nr:hypothetical protein [Nocardioides zeae]MDQ1103065.1 hypothetical protein [Nocardioides zeae]